MSAAPAIPQVKRFSIEVSSGPQKGQRFSFAKPSVFIGRGGENDVVLTSDPQVSRLHVEVRASGGGVSIHNLTEKNPVIVNGKNVRNVLVNKTAKIKVGNSELVLQFSEGKDVARANLQAVPKPSMPPTMPSITNSQYNSAGPTQGFGTPPGANYTTGSNFSAPPRPPDGGSRLMFYSIIGIVALAGYWFFSGNKHVKPVQEIRNVEDVEKDVDVSHETVQEIEKRLETLGRNTPQYQLAQQQYIRGFRDYRVGQYSRSIQSLQAALAFFPQHELARRYLTLAKKKLDEMVKSEMSLATKYRGQGNYRMCVGTYEKVLRLIDNDTTDVNFKEATTYKEECEAQLRDHY